MIWHPYNFILYINKSTDRRNVMFVFCVLFTSLSIIISSCLHFAAVWLSHSISFYWLINWWTHKFLLYLGYIGNWAIYAHRRTMCPLLKLHSQWEEENKAFYLHFVTMEWWCMKEKLFLLKANLVPMWDDTSDLWSNDSSTLQSWSHCHLKNVEKLFVLGLAQQPSG